MVIFWNDHLACRPGNYIDGIEYQNFLRKYALADFGSLLRSVSKSYAMMRFLNLLGSSAQSPNENFARELLELFTLGIGNYTEQDVKEAARAFSGWSYKQDKKQFFFNAIKHDPGIKQFLGRSGSFRGDDIIDILLEQDQTAFFITEKIYKYFVNPYQINKKQIQEWAASYKKSGFNTELLLREILMSDHFYSKQNIGVSIKSPIELMAGIARSFQLDFTADSPLLYLLRIMKQEAMMVPSVNGWPFQREWRPKQSDDQTQIGQNPA